jgi:hypothetical protein
MVGNKVQSEVGFIRISASAASFRQHGRPVRAAGFAGPVLPGTETRPPNVLSRRRIPATRPFCASPAERTPGLPFEIVDRSSVHIVLDYRLTPTELARCRRSTNRGRRTLAWSLAAAAFLTVLYWLDLLAGPGLKARRQGPQAFQPITATLTDEGEQAAEFSTFVVNRSVT